jgi:hypothetical protein
MGKIDIWEMLMCILRMKMNAHLGKVHCHSLKSYQLLLIRPMLGKGGGRNVFKGINA